MSLAEWYAMLILHLEHQHLMRASLPVLAALLPLQLPAHSFGGEQRLRSVGLDIHIGHLKSSWFPTQDHLSSAQYSYLE